MQSAVQGVGLAFLNMNLDIKAPTFVGDTIHVECEVIESELSKTHHDRGLVRTRTTSSSRTAVYHSSIRRSG